MQIVKVPVSFCLQAPTHGCRLRHTLSPPQHAAVRRPASASHWSTSPTPWPPLACRTRLQARACTGLAAPFLLLRTAYALHPAVMLVSSSKRPKPSLGVARPLTGSAPRPRTVAKALAPMTAAKARVRSDTPSSLSSPFEAMSPSMRWVALWALRWLGALHDARTPAAACAREEAS